MRQLRWNHATQCVLKLSEFRAFFILRRSVIKIVMLGDSITDMGRNRELTGAHSYGNGYPFFVEGVLNSEQPKVHTVYNKGISGNRIVDVYARVKIDCWNLQPDLISCLIGINDIWHEIGSGKNGVELDRFIRFYEMLVDDTRKVLPDVRFMLLEPFVLEGICTREEMARFSEIREYAKAIKEMAARKNCAFVPLQAQFDELAEKYGAEHWLSDGVHPNVAGSKVIADAWLKAFAEIEK